MMDEWTPNMTGLALGMKRLETVGITPTLENSSLASGDFGYVEKFCGGTCKWFGGRGRPKKIIGQLRRI